MTNKIFKIKHFIFFIVNCSLLIVLCSTVLGQIASSRLEKTNILLGDQIKLTIEFKGPAELNVTFPAFKDTILKSIEIVEASKIETTLSEDKKEKTYRQVLTITSYDSGYYEIRPFRILFMQSKDTATHYAQTLTLQLMVQNVKVDTQKGIRDIKPPLEANFTLRELLPYLIGLILIIGIIWFVIYYMKKKKRKEPIFRIVPKPKLPPHEIALAALEALRNKKLWQNNQIKEFHSELTEIIRTYIEDRFKIPALEMVSDDIVDTISKLNVDVKTKAELQEMLALADLVKFAKENPLPSEHDKSFNNAIDFVKNTIISINIQQSAVNSE